MKIVFSGPESTGKTTTSKFVAEQLNLPLVEEYAREHIEALTEAYTYEDVLYIARKQIELELAAKSTSEIIVCDTDLITIKIWLQYYSWKIPDWIDAHLQSFPASLYLLMYPNIDWVKDEQRQNEHDRLSLFEQHKKEIIRLGIPFEIVDEVLGKRNDRSLEIVLNEAGSFLPTK
jgi:nicotinamide riboside kinase